jgi:hypothetical protein
MIAGKRSDARGNRILYTIAIPDHPKTDTKAITDQNRTDTRDTITLAEAGKRLGKSAKATKRAVERGELPAIPWGKSYLILRAPFERMLGIGTKDPS